MMKIVIILTIVVFVVVISGCRCMSDALPHIYK